jgi:threonine dehydrogenase-like Zn-dependent dehydrogenase
VQKKAADKDACPTYAKMTFMQKAIAITPGIGGSARLVEIPDAPAPGPGEVRVRVLDIGIDGTDMELYAGHFGAAPPGSDFLVIGHECLGIVEQTGAGTSLQQGDYVAAMVRRPDECPSCRAGSSDLCTTMQYTERGITAAHGFLTSHYTDHEEFVVRIPPELRDIGVMLEPWSVAAKAQRHAWEIQRRLLWNPQRALVMGAGSLGLLAAFLLRLRGLEVSVFSREPADSLRAKLLERAGARYLTELSGNDDYDFVFEATGAPQLVMAGLERLRASGVMVILGVGHNREPMPVPLGAMSTRIMANNQVLFGSVNSNRLDFQQSVTDLAEMERRWPGLIGAMFTRREPFAQFAEALRRGDDDIKVLIEVAA